MRRALLPFLLFSCALLALASWPRQAIAQTPTEVLVKVGKTASVKLPRKPELLGSENTDIASVSVLPDGRAIVSGKKVGSTRLVGHGLGGLPIVIAVRVVAN